MISHSLSMTSPGDTRYENRPEHWNEPHVQNLTISGNTAGQSTFSGTNLVLQGGPNATLSINGNTLIISGGAGAAGNTGYLQDAAAATASLGTIELANANGVTFSINGQTLSGSVRTNFAGLGESVTTTAGTDLALTVNSDGVSIAHPAWLTTAALSNHSHGNPTLALTNLTGTTASNSAGLTLSLSGEAAQTVQTQNFIAAIVSGANGNGTYTSGTLSFKAGNNITLSTGANVFSIHGVAAQTVQSAIEGLGVSNVGNTAGNTGVVTGVDFILAGSGSLTLSQETAAAARTIHIQHPAWLTTAALSNHSHGNPTLALTNLSGTTASASNGFTLSLSANDPGAAAENNWHHALGANTAGNTTASGSTIGLSGINLTISGTNDSVLNLSVPATSSLSATGQVSISTNGSTISIGVPAKVSGSWVEIADGGRMTTCAAWNNATYSRRPIFLPFRVGDALASVNTIRFFASRSSGTVLVATLFAGIYTIANATSLNLLSSTSLNISVSTSAQFSGIRIYDITGLSNMSLSEGNYVLALANSVANSNSIPLHLMGGDQFTVAGAMFSGTDQTSASASNRHLAPFWGVWNATTGALPAAVAASSISGGDAVNSPDVYAIIKAI